MHIILGCLIGAVIGSLVNMLAHRLPIVLGWEEKPSKYTRYNLFLPASHCPKCMQSLKFYHNIPIVSFLLLKGRCAYCKTSFGLRYLIVELLCLFAGALIAWLHSDLTFMILLYFVLTITMALAVIDWETLILPDALTGLLLWSALLLNAFSIVDDVALKDAVMGAALGYSSLWLLNQIYKLICKMDGIGQGDFKLLAAWGAWLGWYALPNLIIIASCSAIAWYLVFSIMHAKFDFKKIIAFGPWLCLGGFSLLLISQLK